MKRILTIVSLAAALFLCSSCLYEESIDTMVEWGFASDKDSNISYGLESVLPSAQTIITAFDNAFYQDYEKMRDHEAVMRAQSSKKSATKHAKKTAEKAASAIPEGHTCPVDGVFVVKISYGGSPSESTTVWSKDYRSAE